MRSPKLAHILVCNYAFIATPVPYPLLFISDSFFLLSFLSDRPETGSGPNYFVFFVFDLISILGFIELFSTYQVLMSNIKLLPCQDQSSISVPRSQRSWRPLTARRDMMDMILLNQAGWEEPYSHSSSSRGANGGWSGLLEIGMTLNGNIPISGHLLWSGRQLYPYYGVWASVCRPFLLHRPAWSHDFIRNCPHLSSSDSS